MVLIWLSCALCCYVHQKASWVWQGRTKAYCLDGLIRLYQIRILLLLSTIEWKETKCLDGLIELYPFETTSVCCCHSMKWIMWSNLVGKFYVVITKCLFFLFLIFLQLACKCYQSYKTLWQISLLKKRRTWILHKFFISVGKLKLRLPVRFWGI
jgi:hypothetical protein